MSSNQPGRGHSYEKVVANDNARLQLGNIEKYIQLNIEKLHIHLNRYSKPSDNQLAKVLQQVALQEHEDCLRRALCALHDPGVEAVCVCSGAVSGCNIAKGRFYSKVLTEALQESNGLRSSCPLPISVKSAIRYFMDIKFVQSRSGARHSSTGTTFEHPKPINLIPCSITLVLSFAVYFAALIAGCLLSVGFDQSLANSEDPQSQFNMPMYDLFISLLAFALIGMLLEQGLAVSFTRDLRTEEHPLPQDQSGSGSHRRETQVDSAQRHLTLRYLRRPAPGKTESREMPTLTSRSTSMSECERPDVHATSVQSQDELIAQLIAAYILEQQFVAGPLLWLATPQQRTAYLVEFLDQISNVLSQEGEHITLEPSKADPDLIGIQAQFADLEL